MERQAELETQEIQAAPLALLIENEPLSQIVNKFFLSEFNYEIEIACNGAEACKRLSRQTYHIIVTDLGLPDMTGKDMIKAIRQSPLNKHTPLIVASAHINAQIRQECIDLGANEVFRKPLSRENFKEAVKKVLLKFCDRTYCHYQLKNIGKKLALLSRSEIFTSAPSQTTLCHFVGSLQSIIFELDGFLNKCQTWLPSLEKKNHSTHLIDPHLTCPPFLQAQEK